MDSPPGTFAGRIAAATLVVCAVVLALLLVAVARDVFLIAFGGVLVALAIRAAVDFLARFTRLAAGWRMVMVLAAFAAVVAGLALLIAPGLQREVEELSRTLPGSIERLRTWLARSSFGKELLPLLDQAPDMRSVLASASSIFFGVLGVAGGGVLLVVVGLYLAAAPTTHLEGVLELVPPRGRDRARSILSRIAATLRRWLVGQLAAMVVVGVLTSVGLAIIGVPMAATLGLLAALLDFVPNFGPFAAGLPAVLLALTISPMTAVYVVLLYLVIQQLEGNLITPLIQERETSLPPVVTLLTQVVFGVVAGPLGLIMATPIAAASLVLCRELIALRDDKATVLGDR